MSSISSGTLAAEAALKSSTVSGSSLGDWIRSRGNALTDMDLHGQRSALEVFLARLKVDFPTLKSCETSIDFGRNRSMRGGLAVVITVTSAHLNSPEPQWPRDFSGLPIAYDFQHTS